MDVSFNNVLESTRQYFQGVPANSPPGAAGGGGGGGGVGVGQPPSQQQQPPLSYWPPKAAAQRPSQDQTNAAAANAQMHAQHQPQQSHYAASAVATGGVSGSKAAAAPPPHRSLYNGTRTAPTSDVPTAPAATLNQRHNLPPIAALTSSAYGGHSRATAVAARHHTPLPSISQITPHKSLSQNRNQPPPTHHFRSPDYPYSSANNRTSNPQYSMQKYSTTNYPNTTTPNTANYPNVSTPSSASYSNATTPNAANYPNVSTPSTASYSKATTPNTASYSNATTPNPANYPNVSTPSTAYSNTSTPNTASYPNVSTPSTGSYSKATTPNTASYSNASTPNTANYPNVSTPSKASYSIATTPSSANYPNVSTPSKASYSIATTPNSANYSTPSTATSFSTSPTSVSYSMSSATVVTSSTTLPTAVQQSPYPAHSSSSSSYPTPTSNSSHSSQQSMYSTHSSSGTTYPTTTSSTSSAHSSHYPTTHSTSGSAYPTTTSSSTQQQGSLYPSHSSSSYPSNASASARYQYQQQMYQNAMYQQQRQSEMGKVSADQQHYRNQMAAAGKAGGAGRQQYATHVQQQHQAYYSSPTNPVRSSHTPQQLSQQPPITTIANNSSQQQTTTSQNSRVNSGMMKRESPLDLSVKTVRQSADSTAKDESSENYLSGYHHHEMLRSTTKTPPKASNNHRQLPSMQYPNYQATTESSTAAGGAPKVDFLPNFSATNYQATTPAAAYTPEPKKRSRKSVTPNLSTGQYPNPYQNANSVANLKKSLPSNLYDYKQNSYYPPNTVVPSPQSKSGQNRNGNMYSGMSADAAYLLDVKQFQHQSRMDYLSQQVTNQTTAESSYKRASTTDLNNPRQAKIPKFDQWKQKFDEQIDLRFKSYASSKLMSEQSVNGVGAKDSSAAVAQNQSVYAQSRYQGGSSSGQNQIQPPISSSQSMASKHHPMYSQPPQRSESGANSSGGNSYNHSMYSTKQSQDVSNYQTGSRLSSSTGSAANKQVLSILRNSLEIREARNLQIAQQQQQVAQEQQYQQKQILHHRGKSYYHLEPMLRMPPQATIPGPPPQNSSSAQSKPPPGVPSPTPPPRHNLPPFGAIAVDRSSTSTPPYPGYKFHLPKAMDSVLIEDHDGARMHRTAGGVEARVSAAPEVLPPPTGADSPTATEMDGLAAFLAARIRTKAELKQVGPGIAGSTASTIPGSNGSVHSPRTTPGIFSPLPAQARTPDIAKGGPSECESAAGGSSGHLGSASSVSTTASPPKLTRERNSLISPRRLFRSDDDSFGTTANTAATTSLPPTGDKFASGLSQQPQPQALQSREAAPRSSSEASVFDFRESDSDGEMPVLERQSLRSAGGGSGGKQRRSAAPGGRKSAATAAAAAQQSTSEMELPEEPPDPFWSATCDDFLTQLTTGKSLLKRRGRRKKKRLKTPPPSTITAPPSPPLPTLPLPPLTPASAKTAMTDLVPPIKRVKEEKTNEEKVKIKKEREKIKEEKEKGKVVVKEEKEKLIEEEVKRKVVKEEKEKVIDDERKSKVLKEEKEKVVKEEKQKVKKEGKDKEKVREKEKIGKKEIVVKEEKVVEKEKERAIEKIVKEEKVVVEKDKERVREKSVKEEKLVEKEKERLRVKEEKVVEKGKKEFICDKILEVKAVKLELGESSDEDVPLSKKLKRGRKPAIKEEPQSEMEDANSSEEEEEESNKSSRRLRERKPREQKRSASEEKKNSEKSSKKQTRSLSPPDKKRQKEKDKLPKTFGGGGGDGSKFAPGWEEDLLKYKKSLRMPARLITISRPANWPRATASLPDLDSPLPSPSPHTNDSADVCLTKKSGDTDEKSKEKLQKSGETDEKSKEKSPSKQEDSFLNRLVQRYGNKGKKSIRKTVTDLLESSDRKPKKIENSNEPELLPTPRLDELIKTPGKKEEVEVKVKKPRGRRPKKDKEIKEKESVANCDSNDNNALYLGYFRKKTVAEFREAFEKHNGAFVGENDLPPVVYESRTRTQTRVLKQQATIREVFGDDRPASAPPAGCRSGDEVVVDNQAKKPGRRKLAITKLVLRKRGNSNSGNRPGLRSAAQLRSSKAVLNSKRQLLRGRQKRNNLKAFVAKQEDSVEQSLSSEVLTTKPDTDILLPPPPPPPAPEAQPGGKKLKLRRKLKSSGFDYIRKKKKQKKDGEMEPPKEKRKSAFSVTKSGLESEQDIQNEIKGWVINKGLGETVLHRAARLGYTDVVAYCLEKLGNNPSPRDNAGYTPLYEACSRNHIEIARLLLLHGANPSDSAQGGIRLLHEASENGFVEVMRLLLSFGADPLLATYAGHTPLSLASTQEARALLQHHLADVQGASAPPWHFNGLSKVFDMEKSGNDPTADAPEAEGEGKVEGGGDELVVEYSEEGPLPNLYTLHDEDPGDRWLLFQEVCATLRIKTRDALLRQLGPAHKNDLRDLKLTEFYDQAHSCMLMSAGDQLVNPRAHKVVMVKYTEQLRKLMKIERDSVPIS